MIEKAFSTSVRMLVAPAWAAWERSPYLRHHRRLLRTQFDSPEVIRRRQEQQLRSLAIHACQTTQFYRERFAAAGLPCNGIDSLDALRALPLLTKSDLRDHGLRLLSTDCPTRQLHHKKTSGSTGVSVEVVVDEGAQQLKRACTLRSDQWTGWRLGERVAAVWGNPEYLKRGWRGRLRNALLERAIYLDTLKMDGAAMDRFVRSLERRAPSLLFGHAHSLYLFADFVRGCGGTRFRPKGIIATAMVLHDFERRLIEDVFKCPVTNRYGCEELSLIACECERHEGLHVNADGHYVEILHADGSACGPGEVGRVVVTDLLNRAMPLLRYEVGDMAAWSSRACPCGRRLPLIEKIEGRVADYVVTPRGEWISGISLTENFAVLVPGIAQLQIIQEAIDRFTFRIVRGSEFGPPSRQRIAELVAERFGHEVAYDCEFLERIPQEPSGKYRFCISKVDRCASMPS
jgi:phenylacetate-CoA ligase